MSTLRDVDRCQSGSPGIEALVLGFVSSFLVSVSGSAQRQSPVPHCARPAVGIDTSEACNDAAGFLPIVFRFRVDSAAIPLSRTDVESIYLDGLVRVLRTGVRIDSAWAIARRDSTHVWASVESLSDRQLQVVMLYWWWRWDRTLNKLCAFDDTLDVAIDSPLLLGAALGAEAGSLAECVRERSREQAESDAREQAGAPQNFLLVTVLPALVLIGGSVLLWWFFLRRPRPDFWKLAARYPDKAYEWFVDHDEWWVVDPDGGPQPMPDTEEYEGPFIFWVPKLGGRRIMVYGRKGRMEDSQRTFLAMRGLDSEGMSRG